MLLGAPAALALAPLLAVIAALYMLRLRRSDRRVPSTLLWRALVQDPPANSPWQRLRRNPLLLLQLAFLALLILALARPFLPTDDIVAGNLILLVDRSASMAATDVAPSRLDAARWRALEIVASAGGSRVTVLAFDDGLEILAAAETDPSVVRAALARLRPVPVQGDLTDAAAFAGAIAQGQPDTQVILLSDGRFDLAPGTTLAAPVRYEPIGTSGDNQAITALSVSPSAAGGPPRLFAQVSSFAREPVRRRVTSRVDGALYDARDVDIPAAGQAAFELDLPDGATLVETALAGGDVLAADDVRWAVRPPSGRARVTLVTPGNRFLETALSLLPSVESVTRVSPDAADGPHGVSDIAVLDGVLPDPLPGSSILAVGPMTSTASLEVAGELVAPVARIALPGHRLVRNVALDDVSILSASALALGPEWTAVVVADVEGRAWPLVAEGTLGGRPAVVVAFDLFASDLPLRPAFPLFMANVLDALAPSTVIGVPATVAPGEPVRLRFSPRARGAHVVTPSGDLLALDVVAGEALVTDTAALGPYVVEVETDAGLERAVFAVNPPAGAAADVRPAGTIALGSADSTAAAGDAERGRRELWWPLGLVALGVLAGEWAYDHRRAVRALLDARGAAR